MLEQMGQRAKPAESALALSGLEQRNKALLFMARMLREEPQDIMSANAKDLAEASELSAALRDRLLLNEKRLEGLALAMEEIAALPDPLGRVLFEDTRPNGLKIRRVAVPLGVIAVIYEARPNVTLDAAAMCLKSGNAVILRGGKEAIRSNTALAELARQACRQAGLPEDCVQLVKDTSRESAQELMRLRAYVDLLIPRGGRGLIRSALDHATVPVLQTGEGVCHIYVDKAADADMAREITVNAKTSRPSVCNAVECLLVHRDIAGEVLPDIARALTERGVELRGDEMARALVPGMIEAKASDWGTEFNDLIMAVRVVGDMDEALLHIETYGTRHSEAIITADLKAAERFLNHVDAAAVYHNASTRFTDGGEFGFGAEIGISTQKLHCRGPVDVKALTSTKYVIEGSGQVR
ncbi:MAG: glutamate-5-semialdehyde dehydrogenase [Clostridiales bacterium]|nr:glutamate-5-semialdehyde dehydrogenase [Clostridiales bacterium]